MKEPTPTPRRSDAELLQEARKGSSRLREEVQRWARAISGRQAPAPRRAVSGELERH